MFTKKEMEIKDLIESTIVPSIHRMMREGNPMYYTLYNGRCCKQIAYLLALSLNKLLPEYEWSAWESMFDESEGWEEEPELYAHAWTFGRNKTNPKHCIILDYGKLEDEYSFFLRTSSNHYPEYLEINNVELKLDKEADNLRKHLKPLGLESFTRKPFEEIFIELEKGFSQLIVTN